MTNIKVIRVERTDPSDPGRAWWLDEGGVERTSTVSTIRTHARKAPESRWDRILEAIHDFERGVASPTDGTLLDRAIAFATFAHHGQYRKETGIPYITHPFDVMKRLLTYGVEDEEVLAAALLHDVVEDTRHTLDDLRTRFGDRVASIVGEVTRPKDQNSPRAKWDYLLGFQEKSDDALLLKVADRVCNVFDFQWAEEQGKRRADKYHAKYALQATPLYHFAYKRGFANILDRERGRPNLHWDIQMEIATRIICNAYDTLGQWYYERVEALEEVSRLLRVSR